jgi:formate-dependent nitrite reductase membrane component NrfD
MPEHFVRAPNWEWYILAYFFLAGLAGGSYAIGAMLRLFGQPRDEPAARLAFYISFPAVLICPLLLTLDLGQPIRFWHMLVDSRTGFPVFRYWSPMSLGAWALLVFSFFAFVSFVEALVLDRRFRFAPADSAVRLLSGTVGRVFLIIGGIFAVFIAGYTGVLLSVSNQPVWSDNWVLGGLFLASGLTGSAAALLLAMRLKTDAATAEPKISEADGYFVLIEAFLIVLFLVSMLISGLVLKVFGGGWLLLWLIVIMSLILPVASHRRLVDLRRMPTYLVPVLALVGVLALRAAVIFSAQV